MFKRIVALIVAMAFISTGIVPPALAQGVLLPLAGNIVTLSPSVQPFLLKGMKVDARDPLRMEFLFDEGSQSMINDDFNAESLRLIKYFLASLTIPNKDLWVNLSPYESRRIVQEDLGRTGMGRDLLAQDYILKQLTAGLLHPDGATGKAFWAEIYRRSFEMFGTTDIPIDTFNKVWIVPGKSVVYQARSPDGTKMSAFVEKLELKVMLESDYLARAAVQENAVVDNAAVAMAKDVLREVVIPVLEKEVNEGSNFAQLRQVCHSLILSSWFKKKLLASAERAAVGETGGNTFAQVFVDQHKTAGVEIDNARVETSRIYDRYVEAFKKGAYNLIKEEVDVYSEELIPRKYFSGGFTAEKVDAAMTVIDGTPDMAQGNFKRVTTDLAMQTKDAAQKSRPWVVKGALGVLALGILLQTLDVPFAMRLEKYGFNTGKDSGGIFSYRPFLLKKKAADPTLDSALMMDIITKVTDGKKEYDAGLIGKVTAAGISQQDFLEGVFSQAMPDNLSEQDQKAWMLERTDEFVGIIQESMDIFGTDLTKIGLSAPDVALMLASIMMRESNAKMMNAQVINGKVQARGLFHFEFATWWNVLSIAEDRLADFPDEFKDFYHGIKSDQNKPRGYVKANKWKNNSKKDMVVDLKTHVRMIIIWWNHMVNNMPIPQTEILDDADHQFITKYKLEDVPEDILKRINTPALTFAEFVKALRDDPKYRNASLRETVIPVLLAMHNGGKDRTKHEWRAILEYRDIPMHAKAEYLEDAVQDLRKVKTIMLAQKGKVAHILSKQKIVDPKAVLTQHSSRAGKLIKAYKYLPDKAKVDFLKAWWELRRLEGEYWKENAVIRVARANLYVDIVLAMADLDKINPRVVAENFRFLYDKAKKAQKTLNLDHAQSVDNAQNNYGGIDLTDENIAEVRGEAGLFGFDLTPDQVAMLKENVNGFLPIIVNVQAVADVKVFLGVR